jgi:hypothetical protein
LCWQTLVLANHGSNRLQEQTAVWPPSSASPPQELRGAWRRLEGAASQGYGGRAAGGTYGPGSPLFAFTSEAAARGTESSCLTLPQQPRAFSTVAGPAVASRQSSGESVACRLTARRVWGTLREPIEVFVPALFSRRARDKRAPVRHDKHRRRTPRPVALELLEGR